MKTVNVGYQQYLQKYQVIKQSLVLPLKINLYFNAMEVALQQENNFKNGNNIHGFSHMFYPIFCQLSKQQKAQYLYSNIEFIKAQYDKIETTEYKKIFSTQNGSSIKATGQISQTRMGLTYWSKVQISFIFETRKMRLVAKNRNFQIDLRLYLIRKSKKYENTFVLQAISDIVSASEKKISLFFRASVFQQIYHELFKCVINYRNQQLFKIALEEYSHQKNTNLAQISYIGSNARSLNFLSSKNLNQFLNFKDQILKSLLKADFNFQTVYSIKQTNIQVNTKKNKSDYCLYKLQTQFNVSVSVLKQAFIQKYKNQHFKYLIQSQKLQNSSNRYTAIYQKFLFNSTNLDFQTIEQIVIEQMNLKQNICENQELIFQKGVKTAKIHNLIDFLMIKVKGLGTQSQSKLMIVGSFNQNFAQKTAINNYNKKQLKKYKDLAQETILTFLLQFSDMIFKKQDQIQNMEKIIQKIRSENIITQENQQVRIIQKIRCENILTQENQENKKQFYTIQGNFNNECKEQLVLHDDVEQQNQLQIQKEKGQKINRQNVPAQQIQQMQFQPSQIVSHKNKSNSTQYLKHSYQLSPSSLQLQNQNIKNIQKNHFIFYEWCRKPKGGITCKDMTAVNEQKKVANILLKNIGKRIFQQKGLFNLSLPVTIFKPESHLQSVAKNLNFAPLLLEKAVTMNPVERMKMVMLYSLSITVSSISVSKPFNPILGQTLQMWIDGYPVYLQQISHHPPIVAYYMVGRGYKVYGSIGPKASFGFNCVTGFSQQPNFVQFNDGTTIELNFGKMIINGIILGQRTFNFVDRMYAIDPKNKIFSELKFGQQKSSIFSKRMEPQDYFYGRIIKTKSQFIEQFYKNSNVTYPTKQFIQEQLSKYEGIWNGKVFFDNIKYIDFAVQNGCVVSQQHFPLPSDSSFRNDIRQLKQGNINKSQFQKQKLQNTQRRDRNLRQNAKFNQ